MVKTHTNGDGSIYSIAPSPSSPLPIARWPTNQVKTAIWTRTVFFLTRLPTTSGKKARRFAATMLVHTGFYCKSAVSRTQTDGCTAPLFLTTRDHARFSVIQALDSAVPGDDSLRTPSSRPSALQFCVDLRSRQARLCNALAARYRPGRTCEKAVCWQSAAASSSSGSPDDTTTML